MAMPKLTDKNKVERAKKQIVRALLEVKNNENRAEVLGYCTGTLASVFALLDADKDDEMSIAFVAHDIMAEVTKREPVRIFSNPGEQLPLIPTGTKPDDQQKSKNASK